MATLGGRCPRGAGMADEPPGRPTVESDLRRLRSLLEARQRQLRARIAACEELAAEMAALQAALGADCRPPCVSSDPGSGEDRRGAAGSVPRPPALPCSVAHRAPDAAGGSSVPGGEGDAEP